MCAYTQTRTQGAHIPAYTHAHVGSPWQSGSKAQGKGGAQARSEDRDRCQPRSTGGRERGKRAQEETRSDRLNKIR